MGAFPLLMYQLYLHCRPGKYVYTVLTSYIKVLRYTVNGTAGTWPEQLRWVHYFANLLLNAAAFSQGKYPPGIPI